MERAVSGVSARETPKIRDFQKMAARAWSETPRSAHGGVRCAQRRIPWGKFSRLRDRARLRGRSPGKWSEKGPFPPYVGPWTAWVAATPYNKGCAWTGLAQDPDRNGPFGPPSVPLGSAENSVPHVLSLVHGGAPPRPVPRKVVQNSPLLGPSHIGPQHLLLRLAPSPCKPFSKVLCSDRASHRIASVSGFLGCFRTELRLAQRMR